MKKVDGMDLSEKASELEPKQMVTSFRDVALGLKEMHSQGVLHRDIKPANMMFDNHGPTKLADFGGAIQEHETVDNQSIGSPAYYPPEVLAHKRQTKASDIYSFGLSMVKVLTGSVLDSPQATFDGYVCQDRGHKDLSITSQMCQRFPEEFRGEFASIVNDCLKLDPKQRISSEQLAARLDALDKKMQKEV